MAQTNIVNTQTGQGGFQVPGAPLQPGWQWQNAPVSSALATAVQSPNPQPTMTGISPASLASQLAPVAPKSTQVATSPPTPTPTPTTTPTGTSLAEGVRSIFGAPPTALTPEQTAEKERQIRATAEAGKRSQYEAQAQMYDQQKTEALKGFETESQQRIDEVRRALAMRGTYGRTSQATDQLAKAGERESSARALLINRYDIQKLGLDTQLTKEMTDQIDKQLNQFKAEHQAELDNYYKGAELGMNVYKTLADKELASVKMEFDKKQAEVDKAYKQGTLTETQRANKAKENIDWYNAQTTGGMGGQFDVSGLSPQQLEQTAAAKAKVLPDATSRESALSGLAVFKNGNELINLLDEKGVNTGPIVGRLKGGLTLGFLPDVAGLRTFGWTSSEANQFAAGATAFTSNYIKSLSGMQVSDKERQFLVDALPNENKAENVNKDNIKVLLEFLANKLSLQLQMDLSPLLPGTKDNTGTIPKGTDGTGYGFPGYVSDGTQWVPK